MARPRKANALTVWMNGELVGTWRLASGSGHEFVYAPSWLASRSARPLSLSLPLRPSPEPYRKGVLEFFENLLPDNANVRERLQRRFKARSTQAFDLLLEIGRDCVGALQLLPEGSSPADIHQITGTRINHNEVGEILTAALEGRPGIGQSGDDVFRISIAGAQEKIALLRHENAWFEPSGTTPSTHIFKLPIGMTPRGMDLSTSVENEWLCAQIASAYQIDVAACGIEIFGDHKVLVVERFDRKLSPDGKWYMRLPQEDFCQATATPPDSKYQNNGGPGIEAILDILSGSERSAEDRREFMRTQILFWLLAAIDGHAKNFSIFHLAGNAYRLTPRYDILSAYPIMGQGHGKVAPQEITMAMAVRGKSSHYRWKEIHARHFIETGRKCGIEGVAAMLDEFITKTPAVVEQVKALLPHDFPANLAETILGGVQKQALQLAQEMTQQ